MINNTQHASRNTTYAPNPTAFQSDLWGNMTVAGDVVDHITYILETFPETRNDYRAMMARYWQTFDGLDELLGNSQDCDAFYQWFTHAATSPKTLQNRCMEIQSRRPELDADLVIQKERTRQSKAGPVR